jgi:fucose 4-O-acetylase-like acetyltransferase
VIQERDASLDIAKAVAIVAIVFGHVWRGLDAAGMIDDATMFHAVDTSIYMWHLTVFAFTAGLFVQRGMLREGPWRYACDRNSAFIWLYLTWTVVQGAVKLVAGSVVNTPTSVPDLMQVWIPDSQLWFFGWIALMMILAAVAQPWQSAVRGWLIIGAVTVGSIVIWGWNGPFIGSQGLALSAYFLVALWWRGDRVLRVLAAVPAQALAILAVVGTGVVAVTAATASGTTPTVGFETRTVTSVAIGVTVSTIGLIAVLALSRLISLTAAGRWVAFIGERSLVIFVAHIVFGSGIRIVLARTGVDTVVVQALIGTVAGVAGPLVLYRLAQRFHFGWLFDAPPWLKRTVGSGDRIAVT